MGFAVFAGPYVVPVLVGCATCFMQSSGRVRLPLALREHFRNALVVVPEREGRALRLYEHREWNRLDLAMAADDTRAADIRAELATITPVGDDGRLTVPQRVRAFAGHVLMLGCGPFLRLAPWLPSDQPVAQRDTPLKAVMGRPCWLEQTAAVL